MTTRVYRENRPVKGQICIVHGLGEHSGRYLGLAKTLAFDGFSVALVDLRGYGMSGGGRSQGKLSGFLADIQKTLELLDGSLPIFLMGHSMGAGALSSPRPRPAARSDQPAAQARRHHPLEPLLPVPQRGQAQPRQKSLPLLPGQEHACRRA